METDVYYGKKYYAESALNYIDIASFNNYYQKLKDIAEDLRATCKKINASKDYLTKDKFSVNGKSYYEKIEDFVKYYNDTANKIDDYANALFTAAYPPLFLNASASKDSLFNTVSFLR